LDYAWIWHRYEWHSRTAIHAHGVVRLKNDPGIADLVETVYNGRLCSASLEDLAFRNCQTEEELDRFQKMAED